MQHPKRLQQYMKTLDSSGRTLVYDSEANGLLDTVTTMWCVVAQDYDTNEMFLFHDYPKFDSVTGVDEQGTSFTIPTRNGTLEQGIRFLNGAKSLIAHNQLGYDQPLMKRFYPWFNLRSNYPEIRDTMLESQVQWFDRPAIKGYKGIHGLSVWGARVGVSKPEIEDWSFMDAAKLNRCLEDVKINTLVARALSKEKKHIEGKCGISFDESLIIEHEYREACSWQEGNGAAVDKPHMVRCTVELSKLVEERRAIIEPLLPPTLTWGQKVPLSVAASPLKITPKRPDEDITKEVDGINTTKAVNTHVKPVSKWLNTSKTKRYGISALDGTVIVEPSYRKLREARDHAKSLSSDKKIKYKYPSIEVIESVPSVNTRAHFGDTLDTAEIIGPFTKVTIEPSTMSQHAKVKQYLISLGWDTDEWTGKKKEGGTGFLRAPYDGDGGKVYWPDYGKRNGKKGINQLSVEYRAGDAIPLTPKITETSFLTIPDGIGETIKEYNTFVNRLNFIENPSKEDKGLLTKIRDDGRVTCGIMSYGTTTSRASHFNWVNPAGVDSVYGSEIREIVVAPKGTKLIGVDMPNAHPRLLADFTGSQILIDAVNGLDFDPDTENYLGTDFHTVNSVVFELADADMVTLARQTNDPKILAILRKARKKGKGALFCLPVDTTEVLTRRGWKYYTEILEDDLVLTMDIPSGEMRFKPILDSVFFEDSKVTLIEDKHSLHLESTEDHRWVVDKRKFKDNKRVTEREVRTTKELNSECKIVRNGEYIPNTTNLEVSEDEASLLGWLLSDGTISWSKKSNTTSSSFGKKKGVRASISQCVIKFTDEIEELLARLGCSTGHHSYNGANGEMRVYNIHASWFREFWLRMGFDQLGMKDIDLEMWCMSVTKERLSSFVDAFHLGDGWTTQRGSEQPTRFIGQNEGNLLDGIVLATYLLGYLPSVQAGDYYDKTGKTCRKVRLRRRESSGLQGATTKTDHRSTDVFCLTTEDSTFVVRQNDCITVTGNCVVYGGSDKKLAITLGVPLKKAVQLKKGFMKGFGLDDLLADILTNWDSKKWGIGSYIEVLGGYQILCNSKHKIINYKALGSEGVLQKVSIIKIYRRMQELGLKTKLILSMHDEALFEVPDDELEIAKPLIANMYIEGAKALGLSLSWESLAMVGENYANCH